MRPMRENDRAALGETLASGIAALMMAGGIYLLDRWQKKRMKKLQSQRQQGSK